MSLSVKVFCCKSVCVEEYELDDFSLFIREEDNNVVSMSSGEESELDYLFNN